MEEKDHFDTTKHFTQPILTKYEKTMVIIERTQQLLNQATPLINNADNYTSVDDIVEEELRQKKIPFIIDLDDAIYFRNENFQKKFNSNSNYDKSFDFSLKKCSKIFAGNKTIYEFVKKYNNNVSMIPTIVNTKHIENKISHTKNSEFTIVWIGSPSTSVYLDQIIKILKKIDKNNIFKLRLIGSKKFQVTDIECEFFEWSEETEFKLISAL